MKPLSECSLYTFIDTAYLGERNASQVAQQLCDGGSDLIQLRAKGSTPEQIRKMAEEILSITRRAKVGLVINDHFSLALELGAELCHLGQEDFFAKGYGHTSELMTRNSSNPSSASPRVSIGLSSHAPPQAERAINAGAAYIAIGPVYATSTKPQAKPVTLEYVRWAAAHVRLPWFAIGGINLQNLEEVLQAGAKRICVVSAILKAPDTARTCQAFKERLLSARCSGSG